MLLPRPQAKVHGVRTRCNEVDLGHGKFCLDKCELFHKDGDQKVKQAERPPSLFLIKTSLCKSLSDRLRLDLLS